jgi:hypothetical protein
MNGHGIELRNVCKTFKEGNAEKIALKDISLSIPWVYYWDYGSKWFRQMI